MTASNAIAEGLPLTADQGDAFKAGCAVLAGPPTAPAVATTHEIDISTYRCAGVIFRDERSNNPIEVTGTLLDLVGQKHVVTPDKLGTKCFSPVVYRPGTTRALKNIEHVTAMVLDFDHLAAADTQHVRATLLAEGWAYIAYTSFSHGTAGKLVEVAAEARLPDVEVDPREHAGPNATASVAAPPNEDCFRVLVVISRPILPEEYPRVWRFLNEKLGGHADPNAKDISRIWFVPSCPEERLPKAWVSEANGRALDVAHVLDTVGVEGVGALVQLRPNLGTKRKKGDKGVTPEGGRNAKLMSIAGGLRRRGAEFDEIVEKLRAANDAQCSPPLEDAEVARIAKSVVRYPVAASVTDARATDLGNAKRFADHVDGRLKYVYPWKSWVHFDGTRWRLDGDEEVLRAVAKMLERMASEASAIEDEKSREAAQRHVLKSEGAPRMRACLDVAKAYLPVDPVRLDAKPHLLCCANGTLELSSGLLRPHDRDDFMTRCTPVAYDPDASCPTWDAFLHRVLEGSAALIEFVQVAIGYALSGDTSEQVLFLLYGTGANGKSTFLETIRALLGEYAAQADFKTFMKRESDGARNDLARLTGTRFVAAVEGAADKDFDEALLKQITGGDVITARFLFKEYFEFKPQFKIWLATNHRPHISGQDEGIWRRIRLVPFTVTIPEGERDPKLTMKLAEELPGILAWAVRGHQKWRADGLPTPLEVLEATAAYRDEMDLVGAFVAACCVLSSKATATAAELYLNYELWCGHVNEEPIFQQAFGKALGRRGLTPVRGTGGARRWLGIEVRPEWHRDARDP